VEEAKPFAIAVRLGCPGHLPRQGGAKGTAGKKKGDEEGCGKGNPQINRGGTIKKHHLDRISKNNRRDLKRGENKERGIGGVGEGGGVKRENYLVLRDWSTASSGVRLSNWGPHKRREYQKEIEDRLHSGCSW